MMQCDLIQHLLGAYLDGELAPDIAGKMAGHLEGCPKCRSCLQNLAHVDGMLQRADCPMPDDTAWAAMEDRLRIGAAMGSMKRLMRTAAVAAAALCLFVLLYFVVDRLITQSTNTGSEDLYTTESQEDEVQEDPDLEISIDRG